MDKIVILGFGVDERCGLVTDERWADRAEVWTCNDWWHFYKRLHWPARAYQIHPDWRGENKDHPWRDAFDWAERYNQSGTLAITGRRYDELKRQRLFDLAGALEAWGAWRLQSSIDYMLYDAWKEDVKVVEMQGVRLVQDDEYRRQMATAKFNSDFLREHGVNVINDLERQWDLRTVDWAKVKEVKIIYK
jgi:hypothetical protein